MSMIFLLAFLVSLAIPAGIAVAAASMATSGLKRRLDRLEAIIDALDRRMFELSTRRPQTPPGDARPESPTGPSNAANIATPPVPEGRPKTPAPVEAPPAVSPWMSASASRPPRVDATAVPPTSVPPASPPPEPPPAPALPTPSLEERLGAHWAVYAGGLALALGGIFLVRYSIEAGLIGPGVRIVMGALVAALLVAGGEWVRRNDPVIAKAAGSAAPHIPSILTAAGTAIAFADIYAAHALYGFIGPAAAFVLLGAVGIVTMIAAAIHGPALAGLGLAGSYVTPLLVSSQAPNPWPVVIFLAVVAAAAHLLARTRRWLWLAAVATAGAVAWGFVLLAQSQTGSPGAGPDQVWVWAAMIHTLVQLGLAGALIAIEPHLGSDEVDAPIDWIATGILAALAFLAITVIAMAPFGDAAWYLFVPIVIGLMLAISQYAAPAAGAAVLAALIALAAMLAWPGLREPAPDTLLAPMLAGVLRLPENISNFLAFALLAAAAIASASTVRLKTSRALSPETTGVYALAATAMPLLALVLAYLRVTQFDTSIRFGAAGIVLALGFAALAEGFQRRADADPTVARKLAAGAYAAAAIAALSLALVATLERGYLTVAFALTAFGTAYISTLRDIPLLRYAVAALGLVVLGRIAWDPRIMGGDVGHLPVLNWLLIGYGVPALAFAGAARLLREKSDDLAVRLADALSVILAGLLAFFEIHHAMNGGDLRAPVSGHVEQGLMALTSLGLTHALTRMDLARANVVFRYGSLAFAAISGVLIAAGLGVFNNPYLTGDRVAGGAVFSSLIPGYLLPGLAALYVARHARGVRPGWYVTAASVLGLALVFWYVTMEVRHLFQGAKISAWHRTSGAEQWTTTVAWLALGIGLLAYGWWRQSLEARMASAALVVLTAVKVVFIDLAGASGLWRALSFLCLGAVLIGIGLAYQRLIFARPGPGNGTGA